MSDNSYQYHTVVLVTIIISRHIDRGISNWSVSSVPAVRIVRAVWVMGRIVWTPQARIHDSEGGGFVQEFRLENRSYPDVHDFSLRMRVIIANANNIADSRRGGFRAPKEKNLYPRLCGIGNYYLTCMYTCPLNQ